jgi:hypothetical protein
MHVVVPCKSTKVVYAQILVRNGRYDLLIVECRGSSVRSIVDGGALRDVRNVLLSILYSLSLEYSSSPVQAKSARAFRMEYNFTGCSIQGPAAIKDLRQYSTLHVYASSSMKSAWQRNVMVKFVRESLHQWERSHRLELTKIELTYWESRRFLETWPWGLPSRRFIIPQLPAVPGRVCLAGRYLRTIG